jgi:hypothetical protein
LVNLIELVFTFLFEGVVAKRRLRAAGGIHCLQQKAEARLAPDFRPFIKVEFSSPFDFHFVAISAAIRF